MIQQLNKALHNLDELQAKQQDLLGQLYIRCIQGKNYIQKRTNAERAIFQRILKNIFQDCIQRLYFDFGDTTIYRGADRNFKACCEFVRIYFKVGPKDQPSFEQYKKIKLQHVRQIIQNFEDNNIFRNINIFTRRNTRRHRGSRFYIRDDYVFYGLVYYFQKSTYSVKKILHMSNLEKLFKTICKKLLRLIDRNITNFDLNLSEYHQLPKDASEEVRQVIQRQLQQCIIEQCEQKILANKLLRILTLRNNL